MQIDAPTDDTPGDGAGEPPDHSSIVRTLELIGDRWTMLVLRASFRGLRRFDEMRRDLGIARPVLAERLRKLVAGGLLEKVPYQLHPVRHEYRLTPMGIDLSPALVALMRWGDHWLSDEAPTTVLVHSRCGTELEQGFWCPRCATTFGPLGVKGVAVPTETRHA